MLMEDRGKVTQTVCPLKKKLMNIKMSTLLMITGRLHVKNLYIFSYTGIVEVGIKAYITSDAKKQIHICYYIQ